VADKRTANAFADTETGINKVFSEASDGASSQAKRRYMLNKEAQESLAPGFKDNEKAINTLRSISKSGKEIKRELLEHMDGKYNTGLIDSANKVKMFDTFGKGAKGVDGSDIITGPQTPLSKGLAAIGGIAGWKMGSAQGALAGSAGGQAIGKKLSSPKAIRTYIEQIIRAEKKTNVLDKKTKDWMRTELYNKFTKGDALRETLKTTKKLSDERG
jgi:hypothetical protein